MAAEGVVAECTQLMAELIASSTSFQAATGTASEAAALAHVYMISAKGSEVTRPFAVVSAPLNEVIGRGGFASGEILVLFEMGVADPYKRQPEDDGEKDMAAASEPLRNLAGKVAEEVMIEQENGGRLLLRMFRQDSPIVRSKKPDPDDYCQLLYRALWGTAKG